MKGVGINKGVNATHINPFLTRLSPKDQNCHVGLELSHGQHTPNGMAGVFGQDQAAGLLNYLTWPVIFIDSPHTPPK
jgi:hypothetical protein